MRLYAITCQKYDQSHAVVEMQNNFYVDDFISGADTEEEEGAALLSEAQSVMAEAGMVLSKCTSHQTWVRFRVES